MEGEKECKKLSLPQLCFELHRDRIVVKALTYFAMDTYYTRSDDFEFLGPKGERWGTPPILLDETGKEDNQRRLPRTSDTGWVRYFHNGWTEEERKQTFVRCVLQYVYTDPIIFYYSHPVTMRLKKDWIMFGENILHIFNPKDDTAIKCNKYEDLAKRVISEFIQISF